MLNEKIQNEFLTHHGRSPTLEALLTRHYSNLLPKSAAGIPDFTGVEITPNAAGDFSYSFSIKLADGRKYYLKLDTTYKSDSASEATRRNLIIEFRRYSHEQYSLGKLEVDCTEAIATDTGAFWSAVTGSAFDEKTVAMSLEPFVETMPAPREEPHRWSSYDLETVIAAVKSHISFIKAAILFEQLKKLDGPELILFQPGTRKNFSELKAQFLIALDLGLSGHEKLTEVIVLLQPGYAGLSEEKRLSFIRFAEALNAFENKYEALATLPHAPVHGDYHFGNLLRSTDGRLVAVDLDSATRGSLIHEITYYPIYDLLRGNIRALQTAGTEVSFERVLADPRIEAALDLYDRSFGLSEAELDMMKYIRLMVWQCASFISKFCKTKDYTQLSSWAESLRDGLKIENAPWPDLKPLLLELRSKRATLESASAADKPDSETSAISFRR